MFTRIKILLLAFGVLSLYASGGEAGKTSPAIAPAFGRDDIDLAACRAYSDGEEIAGDHSSGALAALGWAKGEGWVAGRREQGKSRAYLFVLKKAMPVGSVLAPAGASVKILKAGAEPLPKKDELWEEVKFPPAQCGWSIVALPPGTATRAFLLILTEKWGDWHKLPIFRAFRQRLHNIVPAGMANAEAEYTEYHRLSAPTFYT
ncbi:MAG: hypothetical protein N3A66_11400, partial [Planctomycetota bacterium]|nr:hypothetical protein [Planctomycetota bacterium]